MKIDLLEKIFLFALAGLVCLLIVAPAPAHAADPPAAPSQFTVIANTENGITLSWQDNSGGQAEGFGIVRSSDGRTDWVEIGNVAGATTTFTDSNLAGSRAYFYTVYAFNQSGSSDFSNVAESALNVYLPVLLKPGAELAPAKSFDLTISLYRSPGNDERPLYQNIIGYFADAVYEMSNGAHKIGRVTFYTNGANFDQAHIQWIGSAWANATVSGYDRVGNGKFRIQVGDQEQARNNRPVLTNEESMIDAGYTIGHEWGHFFYGLADEYRLSPGGFPGGSSISPRSDDTPVEFSVMNAQYRALPQDGAPADFRWLNFSTPLNNTQDDNAQKRLFGASAWPTLGRSPELDPRDGDRLNYFARLYYPELAAVAPPDGQAPSLELPGLQGEARSALQINWITPGAAATLSASGEVGAALDAPNGVIRQMVIESSAGIAAGGRFDDIKAALQQMVDQAEIGDVLGLINFADTVTVVVPLTVISNQATKDSLAAAIDGLTPEGSRAAIGAAAHQALEGLTAPDVPVDAVRAVYLIADGQNTNGSDPLDELFAYQEARVSLYTFGYGTSEDATATLQQMAEETDGQFYYLGGAEANAGLNDLLDALEDADADTSPIVDVTLLDDLATVTSSPATTIPFHIDPTLGQVEVEIVYPAALADATIELVDPDNNVIATNTEPDCTEIGAAPLVDTLCLFSLADPLTGDWNMVASASGPEVDLSYWVGGVADSITQTLDAEVYLLDEDESIQYSPDEPTAVIEAVVFRELAVTDVGVNATIELPNGTISPLTMRDDGLAPDRLAQDGLYAASIPLTLDGDYNVTVIFDNNAGTAKFTEYGEALGAGLDGTVRGYEEPFPVGMNFVRTATTQFTVAGAP